jgi:hypothetical protein
MKYIISLVLVIALMIPASATAKSVNVVSQKEYNTIQIGWTKSEVRNYLDQSGKQTEVWDDPNSGSWQQYKYNAVNGAVVYIDYNYNGTHWTDRYMTWCDGYMSCGQVKVDPYLK